jgi:uncharacterized protein YeaO (DUF488 family)
MTRQPLRIKRVYQLPDTEDGVRVLVDRLWPRGLSREKARIDLLAMPCVTASTTIRRLGKTSRLPIVPNSSSLPRSRRSAICSTD